METFIINCQIVNVTKKVTMVLLTLQRVAGAFEMNIEEFLQGLEPISGVEEDHSSESESSATDSSGSDSEVLYFYWNHNYFGFL